MIDAHDGCIMSYAHTITFCVSFTSILFSAIRHFQSPPNEERLCGLTLSL
jgi:hypothetical protein